MPIAEIGELAKRKGIFFMVDGAQGAGCMPLDVAHMHIDMLAFPGHKGLLGPQGSGGLYASPRTALRPMLEGGTGTESKSREQPREFPEGFEAGTINAPAIIGLGRGTEFVAKIGVDVIARYEEELISYLDASLDEMPGVLRYGPPAGKKTGITLFNIEGLPAEEVTATLNNQYGIAVRGGYHCAGLAHKSIGTWEQGGVRVSVGPFNTKAQMQKLTDAVWQISSRQTRKNRLL